MLFKGIILVPLIQICVSRAWRRHGGEAGVEVRPPWEPPSARVTLQVYISRGVLIWAARTGVSRSLSNSKSTLWHRDAWGEHHGLCAGFPWGTLRAEEGAPACLTPSDQTFPDTTNIRHQWEEKSLLGFVKNPIVDEAQLYQVANRVLVVECVLFHCLILSAHKTNSAKLVEANCQIKTFRGR